MMLFLIGIRLRRRANSGSFFKCVPETSHRLFNPQWFSYVFSMGCGSIYRRLHFSRPSFVLRTLPLILLTLKDVPAVASFYSEVERSFHTIPFVNFAERYWKYAWVICAVYVVRQNIGELRIGERSSISSAHVIKSSHDYVAFSSFLYRLSASVSKRL